MTLAPPGYKEKREKWIPSRQLNLTPEQRQEKAFRLRVARKINAEFKRTGCRPTRVEVNGRVTSEKHAPRQ